MAFRERRNHHEFANEWDQAMRDAALGVAEPALLARGLEKSDTALLGFLNARLPELYRGASRGTATQTRIAARGIVIELTSVETED